MEYRTRLDKIPTKYRREVENQLNSICDAIQSKREVMDLTQEQLAEKLGITTIALQFIEQKRRYPSLPLLAYICRILEIKIHIG